MPFVTGRKENIIDFYLYFLSFLVFLPCPRSETHQPDCCREPFVLGRDALQRVLGRWAGFGGKIPTNWLMGCISDGVGGSLLVFALSRCRACPRLFSTSSSGYSMVLWKRSWSALDHTQAGCLLPWCECIRCLLSVAAPAACSSPVLLCLPSWAEHHPQPPLELGEGFALCLSARDLDGDHGHLHLPTSSCVKVVLNYSYL